MVVDPYFSNIEKNKSKPRISWSWLRWLRWLLVYPLLGLAGCHMLMTGSPVPLSVWNRLISKMSRTGPHHSHGPHRSHFSTKW
jgi:hypothetical protein